MRAPCPIPFSSSRQPSIARRPASNSAAAERHQQQFQVSPSPSPSPPFCTSSPALPVGATPLGARSRVAGVPPQRCRLEPPPCAKSRHGHHLPDALAAAARPPRCHQGVPWPPPRPLESSRPPSTTTYGARTTTAPNAKYNYEPEDLGCIKFLYDPCTTT